jgi:hypothetical protein
MVPQMKRAQHDKVLAQQELMRSGLAKVDPYSKHFDEAIRLKQDLESKMDATATELASNGINNDMIGKTLALNREVQDLTSPTGKLGQINAEKQNIQKINDEYDKLGKEKGWPQELLEKYKSEAIAEYNNVEKNPIWDPNTGRLNSYKGPISMANKVDYAKLMNDYASKAEMSVTQFAKAAQGLSKDEASGQNVVNGTSYSKKFGNNYQRVLDAYNTMKRELNDTTSEVHKSMVYEGRDPKALIGQLANQSEIYKQSSSAEEIGNTINPFGSAEGGSGTDDVPGIDSTTTSNFTVGGTESELNELDKIGKSNKVSLPTGSPLTMGTSPTFEGGVKPGVPFSYKDLSNPLLVKRFKNTYDALVRSGRIKNAKGIDKDEQQSTIRNLILDQIKKDGPITISTKTIKPNQEINDYLFPSKLIGKDEKETSTNVQEDIWMNAREVYDLDTGKLIPSSEFKKKDGYKVNSYYGYDSPHNLGDNGKKMGFGNKKQGVMPHRGTIITPDGEIHRVAISRDDAELGQKKFSVSEELHNTYESMVLSPNTFVPFDSKVPAMKGVEVKYRTRDKDGYELQEPEVDVKRNGKQLPPMTESQYMKFIMLTRLKM